MLVAIQDEGSLQSRPAFAELRRLGARDPISNSYRGSYALVGYAGSPRPSWVKQEQRNSGKGPSVITVKIPIGGGGGGGISPPPPPSGKRCPLSCYCFLSFCIGVVYLHEHSSYTPVQYKFAIYLSVFIVHQNYSKV